MPEPWPWPEELDAVVAAPDNHLLLFENEFVRVLDNRVPRGCIVPLHTHRWPGSLYLLSWSHIVRRDATGAILMDSRLQLPPLPGSALWSPVMPPHTLENVGDSEFRVICVELKLPEQPQSAMPGFGHSPLA